MKVFTTVILSIFVLTLSAQDNIHVFKSSKLNVNIKGEKIETSTAEPSVITVDLGASTVTIETSSTEIHELLKEKMTLHIDKQMGAIGPQYSLKLDEFIFAHFYMDMQMIIFTRADIHPLESGIQFLEIEKVGA
jgi:hypothetical protein